MVFCWCNSIVSRVVMEVKRVGVMTRARAKTTKVVGEEIADNLGSRKRRRLSDAKKRPHSSSFEQIQSVNREVSVNAAARLRSVSSAPAFCCSSTGSVEKLKVSDLEEDIISAENETVVPHNLDGSESNPTMEVKSESVELDSCTPKQSALTSRSCTRMPSEAELEEFFTAANKDLTKRFTDKYNYDIVNDIPLKGRFEWIQLKPST